MIDKIDFSYGGYDVLPCGVQMTLCNNAFIDLCNRFDDILSSSFEELPRGDKNRVRSVGDNIMMLITNSFYSLTWLNAKQYNLTHPTNPIDTNNINMVAQASQATTLRHYYKEHAIKAFERWMSTKKF